MWTSLGSGPERSAGAGDLVRREVVQQLLDLIAEVVLEQMPRPRHAVCKVLRATVNEDALHRFDIVHLQSKSFIRHGSNTCWIHTITIKYKLDNKNTAKSTPELATEIRYTVWDRGVTGSFSSSSKRVVFVRAAQFSNKCNARLLLSLLLLLALPQRMLSRVYASAGHLSVCPSRVQSSKLCRCCPAGKRYRSIAAWRTAVQCAVGECGQCHIVSIRSS